VSVKADWEWECLCSGREPSAGEECPVTQCEVNQQMSTITRPDR